MIRVVCIAAALAAVGFVQEPPPDGAARADAAIEALRTVPTGSPEDDQRIRVAAFDAFIERMDAFDGDRSIALGRAMHAEAGGIWSVFCLEGALRRSAGADPTTDGAALAFREADGALTAMLDRGGWSRADRLALIHRRAILAAGFDDLPAERFALGAALALGGIDGAQITGLSALARGDRETAARLFGKLIDEGHPPDSHPWSVRGHGLAVLDALRTQER